MWQRLSHLLAPEVSELQDLEDRWQLFLDFYTGSVENAKKRSISAELVLLHRSQPVEQTHLPFQLRRILNILVSDCNLSGESWSKVFELDVLDVLSTICQADCPPGIRPMILEFFLAILGSVGDERFLRNNCAIQPLKRLLLLATLQKASPTEDREIRLASCIVSRVRRNPSLLVSFDVEAQNSINNALTSAVLNLAESADAEVAVRSMDNLVVIAASVNDEITAKNIISGTNFVSMPLNRLRNAFNQINWDKIEPRVIDEVGMVSWASHIVMKRKSEKYRHEVMHLLSCLDFVDHLVATSYVKLAEELSQTFRKRFLRDVLEPKLTSNVALIALLTQIWRHLSKDHGHGLAQVTVEWLVDDVLDKLIRIWAVDNKKKDNNNLILESLGFFDALLSKPCEAVLKALVLDCLAPKCHLSASSSSSLPSSPSLPPPNWSELILRKSSRMTSIRSGVLAPSNIGRVLNAWLFLVPEDLRQDHNNATNDGFEQYLRNAENSVRMMTDFCMAFDWPIEYEDEDEEDNRSSDSRPEAEKNAFKESHFLKALLDRVQNMAENEYNVNLQITALVAKLVQLPHPDLHLFMLNPTTQLASDVRSLHTCLRRALSSIGLGLSGVSNLARKSRACKRRLLMLSDEERRQKSTLDETLRMLTPRELTCLEALIIIEEFAKELAAITLAKYHIFAP